MKEKIKRRKIKNVQISIIVIVILLMLSVTVFGRYIYNSLKESYLLSKKFYFNSNILTVNGTQEEYNNWGGKGAYPIILDLYSMLNSAEKLDYNLNYTLTCTTDSPSKIRCGINSYGDDAQSSINGTIYTSNNNVSSMIIYVIPTEELEENDKVKVTITARTTEPYRKTISGEFSFTINKNGENIYWIEDQPNRDYALLKITTQTYDSTITVDLDPTKFRVDSNDEAYINRDDSKTQLAEIDGYHYVSRFVFDMAGESTQYIKLYKVDKTQNYTNDTTIRVTIAEHRLLQSNVMMADANDTYVFGTEIKREDVETVTFLNTIDRQVVERATLSKDISIDSDKSVMLYLNDSDNNSKYEMYIAADGNIYATSGYKLFENYTNMIEINNMQFLDTSNVTNMEYMFYNCEKLTNLDLSNLDTRKVATMQSMFQNCSSITELDLSTFDTINVTNMWHMFFGCIELTTIYASEYNSETHKGWNTQNVTNSESMLANTTKITGGNGTTYDANHIDKEYARIDGENGLPGYLTNSEDKEL